MVPPEIEAIQEDKGGFLGENERDAKRFLTFAHKLGRLDTTQLMAEGMPEKAARAKAGKQANEDARFVLPNACGDLADGGHHERRSLQNFFHLRCSRAQWRSTTCRGNVQTGVQSS